jgi:hypothetical protein
VRLQQPTDCLLRLLLVLVLGLVYSRPILQQQQQQQGVCMRHP